MTTITITKNGIEQDHQDQKQNPTTKIKEAHTPMHPDRWVILIGPIGPLVWILGVSC
jgi:hypothetical protein